MSCDQVTSSSSRGFLALAISSVTAGATLLASILIPNAADANATEPTSVVVTFANRTHVGRAVENLSAFALARKISEQSVVVDATPAVLEKLQSTSGVVAVEPNITYKAADLPNDPCITSCNGLSATYINQIELPSAWSNSRGSGVTIAVLDGGIDPSNNDITSKLVAPEVDYVGDGASTHGTSVAALAGAATNNGVGVAGTGWDATLRSYKVLDQNGVGLLSEVVAALDAASASGARVISMAFAGTVPSAALDNAIASARSRGSVIVAAAGNEASTQPVYPAASPGVIGVGSVTASNAIADFSNSGPWVDLYAPGVSLPAPNNQGVIKPFTGTSASTPVVAGVAALLLARQPHLSVDAVTYMLALTAKNIGSGTLVLDAGKAVSTWAPYQGFASGVHIAGGNVNGDSTQEVVTGAGRGGGPHVIVAERTGQILGSFFAYNPAFNGGVDVAAGDIDGDGRDEIITGPGPGGGPHVRSFSADGSPRTSFFPYDPSFPGGVSVAAGDIDGDGRDEIITGAGPGGGPHVTVRTGDGALIASFFAYSPGFPGGVDVAAGDIDGDGRDEIITGPGPGGGPHVAAFSLDGALRASFFAYDPGFTGGVSVSSFDLEGDGIDEILTGAGPGGGPHVTLRRGDSTMLRSLFAFDPSFTGGVDVGSFDGSFLMSAATGADSARIMFLR